MTSAEAGALEYDWKFWARGNQLTPPGDWTIWLILAGRGFGKTRCGAEWVRSQVEGQSPLIAPNQGFRRMAFVGETAADVRDVMIEGESGILACSPPWYRPRFIASRRQLIWPNGARATLYNATEPDQLRGPQHTAAWCEEICKWQYARETWDQLQFGLRLGPKPQQVITTTPRPIPVLKEIMARSDCVTTRGSTYENVINLAPAFAQSIISRYKGTRLGRQEINAEILDDVPGALWTLTSIDAGRAVETPEMSRITIGIDPGISGKEGADETGIVACGKARDHGFYVVADRSGVFSPDEWGKRAVKLHDDLMADCIVGEVNQGGDMVASVIRTAAEQLHREGARPHPIIRFRPVHAKRGKYIRAEPVAMLYEQGRVHHVGSFPRLEDQMTTFTPDSEREDSPDRLDALVWAMTDLMAEPSAYPLAIAR